MQAGAMELPCIVSDINGCNEIITEGYNGVIIPAKDEKELFKAMKLMTEKPDHRLELKENSREQICRFYETKGILGSFVKRIQKIRI